MHKTDVVVVVVVIIVVFTATTAPSPPPTIESITFDRDCFTILLMHIQAVLHMNKILFQDIVM